MKRHRLRRPVAAGLASAGLVAAAIAASGSATPEAAAASGNGTQLRSLKGITPPLPDLTGIVVDNAAAIALGKALFWDSNAGSDGQACASCHFHAGADVRYINQLDPDIRGVPSDVTFQPTQTGAGGPNYAIKPGDFPFHKLADVKDRQSAVLFDSNDVVSSAGTFAGRFTSIGNDGSEACEAPDPRDATSAAFTLAGKGLFTRRVEPRNVPTVVNAGYNYRNFWDGRANNVFNGVDPFGLRNTGATVFVADGAGNVVPQKLALGNASLASQAVGPALSDMEMSCASRAFADVGKKLVSRTALASQIVSASDSVLGPWAAAPAKGLKVTYEALIRKAFDPKYWSSPALVDGRPQTEANFSMFWGISIMLYEATLNSDDSPFDRYMDAGQKAVPGFGDVEKKGMDVFTGKGQCTTCHAGPLFTKAAILVNGDPVMEFRDMATGGSALTDTGFANIGARPTRDDQGLGTTDPFGNPWSFTRQFLTTPVDQFSVDIGPLSALTQRVAIDGAMKVPGLRNVAQTPPYFHHGGEGTLGQVVEFYSRGGDRRNVSGGDTSGTGALGEDDAGQVGPSGSNVDGKIAKLGFSTQEQANLVAFLKSLTDDRVRCHAAPFDHPELMISHGVDPAGTPNGKGEAAERFVTLAATGKAGLGAKCAAIANDGDVTQLPAALGAMTK